MIYQYQQDGYHIAHAPSLRIVGYGKSISEAMESLWIQLQIFLEETSKRGTLYHLLEEYGWKEVN